MSSAVDIANLALSHLGQNAEIIDISPPDGSAEAQHAGRFYPMARDELLEMHSWTFATRRTVLASVTGVNRPAWQYAYALPADCLRPLSLAHADAFDDSTSVDHAIESDANGSRVLYANTPDATLRYIARVEDTTKFTPGFVSSLSRLLAAKLAGPIIKGVEGARVAEAMMKMFLLDLANAKTADSNSGSRRVADFVPASIRARGYRFSNNSSGGFR